MRGCGSRMSGVRDIRFRRAPYSGRPAHATGRQAMMRGIALLLMSLAVVALAAPALAPYDPEAQYRRFLFAPPMTPRLLHAGELRAPFVYPVTLTDRLSQRYDEDRKTTRPLPWFTESGDP